MVGVVVDLAERLPEGTPASTKIREVTKALEPGPALTPKLIELAHWIAGYYLAPVGEVFRAMLPPVTELRTQRQIILTEAGRSALATPGLTLEENAFLAKLKEKKALLQSGPSAKLGVDRATLERLRRHGLIE